MASASARRSAAAGVAGANMPASLCVATFRKLTESLRGSTRPERVPGLLFVGMSWRRNANVPFAIAILDQVGQLDLGIAAEAPDREDVIGAQRRVDGLTVGETKRHAEPLGDSEVAQPATRLHCLRRI